MNASTMHNMATTIRIGLVDDQLLFRTGLKSILEQQQDFSVDFESSEGYTVAANLELLSELPHVMLIDLSLPPDGQQTYSGRDLVVALQKAYPAIKLLVLSVEEDPFAIAQLIELGASGYLVKSATPSEVCAAIRAVHVRGSYINQRALEAIQLRLSAPPEHFWQPATTLTRREVEVLQLICQQQTAEQIGKTLFISPKTVNGHRNNLLLKTESRNIAGLVMYAVKNGMVALD